MAGTIALAEAAQTLADHFGPHLDAGHEEGRDVMVDALREHFGIAAREARQLVEALERAGTIRWSGAVQPGASGRPHHRPLANTTGMIAECQLSEDKEVRSLRKPATHHRMLARP